MLTKNLLRVSIAAALSLASAGAAALPFSSFDPRSFAMGGVGVAAGTSSNAVFFNPALLSVADEGEDFSLELPVTGARLSDPDNLLDAVDSFNNADPISAMSSAVDAYTATPNAANAAALQAAGDDLITRFQDLSNKALQAEGDVALVVGLPGGKLGVSVYANAYVVGGTVGEITASDIAAVQQAIDDAAALQPVTDPTSSLTSAVSARFAVLAEAGVALSRKIDAFGGFAVGITPKYVEVRTYDYRFVGSSIDTAQIDLNQGERSENDFNFDLGLAKDYGNGWKVGLAVRNLIAKDYTTVLGNTLKIEPSARLGVSRHNSWFTVAADLDLTENEPVGFESRTQYATIGAELNLFDTAQLRFGFRHNLADIPSDLASDTVSAGVGFSPFGVHVDASVAGNSDEIGGALQLGFRF